MALLLLVAACGGGSGDDTGDTVAADDSPKATLGIITTEIETALGDAAFTEATEGQQLDVGDRVRTDTTGFAEITYHDGSWQRVEAEATLTILALSADASVNAVRTGHDIGRTWNNVQELDGPVDADTTDPWITKNQDLDTQRNGDVEDGPVAGGATCVGLTADDVGDAAGQPMQLRNGREDPEGVSLCLCSSIEDRALAPPREPVDVGEAGAWYPEQDVLVAHQGGRCHQLDQATAGSPDLTRDEAVALLRLAIDRDASGEPSGAGMSGAGTSR